MHRLFHRDGFTPFADNGIRVFVGLRRGAVDQHLLNAPGIRILGEAFAGMRFPFGISQETRHGVGEEATVGVAVRLSPAG